MKRIILTLGMLGCASAFAADEYVHGHYNQNGAYVQGYHRTEPDSNLYNNYSTKGNVNPYTGQEGRVEPKPYQTPRSSYPEPSSSSGYSNPYEQRQRCTKDMYGNVSCY